MVTVGVNTLKRNLSAVLKKVENGESISITSRGHEIALLVPPGKIQGQVKNWIRIRQL